MTTDIAYTLGPRTGLVRFLEDVRLAMEISLVEFLIRPIAVTRKKALPPSSNADTKL
jgi:hypothetical protein